MGESLPDKRRSRPSSGPGESLETIRSLVEEVRARTAREGGLLSGEHLDGILLVIDQEVERLALGMDPPGPSALGQPVRARSAVEGDHTLSPARRALKARILEALEQARWNRRRAAAMLGMPYSTLRHRMARLGIE
jgi:transcriptional regulator with GAF, ATPase, and Fis domain